MSTILQNFILIGKGFVSEYVHFCACTTLFSKLFTRLFCQDFWFLQSPTAKAPTLILTRITSKDVVPHKDVPFGSR